MTDPTEREIIPQGTYRMRLYSSRQMHRTSGKYVPQLCYKIVAGKYAGRKVFITPPIDTHIEVVHRSTAKDPGMQFAQANWVK